MQGAHSACDALAVLPVVISAVRRIGLSLEGEAVSGGDQDDVYEIGRFK